MEARRAVIVRALCLFVFFLCPPWKVGSSPTPRLRRPPREWRGCGLWEPVIHRNNSEIRLFSPMLSYSAGPYRVLCPTTIARPALLYPHRAKLRPNRWPTPPEGRDPASTRNADLSGDLVGRQLVGRYCRGRDLFCEDAAVGRGAGLCSYAGRQGSTSCNLASTGMRRRPPVFRGPEKFRGRSLLAGSLIKIFGRLRRQHVSRSRARGRLCPRIECRFWTASDGPRV